MTLLSVVIAPLSDLAYAWLMGSFDPDQCPVARAAAIIGGRWTAGILRDLVMKGPCRYQDFIDELTGIPPSTLSSRLKMLEQEGIVMRRFYAEHPPRADYVLTDKGRDLAPILLAMRDWGRKHHR